MRKFDFFNSLLERNPKEYVEHGILIAALRNSRMSGRDAAREN